MRIPKLLVLAGFYLLMPVCSKGASLPDFAEVRDSVVQLMESGKEEMASKLWEESLTKAKAADSLIVYLDLVKAVATTYRNRQDYHRLFATYQRGQVESLWRQPADSKEAKALGWLYSQIAYAYDIKLGKYLEAAKAYEAAEKIFADWGIVNPNVARYVWWRLGNIYTRLGDLPAAALKLEAVANVMKAAEHHQWEAEIYNDLGLLYRSWGLKDQAQKAFQKGLTTPDKSTTIQMLMLLNYCDLLVQNEDTEAAIIQLNKAKTLLPDVRSKNEHYANLLASGVSKRQANIAMLKKDFIGAKAALDQEFESLQTYYGTTQRREFGKHHVQYGQLFLEQDDYQNAISKFQEALKSTIYNYDPKGLFDLPSKEDFYAENTIVEALDKLVDAYRLWYEKDPAENKLITALECHKLIYAVDQELRRSYLYDSSKLFNLEESRDRSEKGIALAQQLFERTGNEQYLHQAFVFAERNRSSLLREAYRTAQASALSGVSKKELAEEEALKYEISEAQEELFRLRASADVPDSLIQQAEQDLFLARAALDNWITELEAKNPRYFQLKYADVVPGIDTLQEMLCGQQLMIEYFLGKEQLFVFTLDKKKLRLYQLSLPETLQDRVVAWRRNIQDYQYTGVDKSKLMLAYREEAYRLYQELLVPVLGTRKTYEELLIVPSGILDLLPFEALLTQPISGQMSFQDYPYLLRDYVISYTYSASLQWSLSQLPRKGSGRIGFAPEFNGDGGWAPVNCSGDMLQKELAGEEDMLRLSRNATIAEFNALAGRYRLLHLATHAQANPEQGDFSFIVFSDGQGGYDSLFAKDLYPLNIEAELVILGACETALGTIYNSEGVISLARGFHFAGARSVLTTLWSINEGANCTLMSEFYEYLDKGESKKDALRAAKLALLEEDPMLAHPVYWAGFQLLGNPRPLNEGGSLWWWLGLTVLMAGSGYVTYRFRKTQ